MTERTLDDEARTELLIQMLYAGQGKFVKTRHLAYLLGQPIASLSCWMQSNGKGRLWIESKTGNAWKLREGVLPMAAIKE